jgi:asparagine synthase (glutamine-hydrolysing)
MEAVRARLLGNYGGHILLRGVESLPAGHCLEVTPNGINRSRWWRTLDHLVSVPQDTKKQAEEFRELLFDACRLRLRCDVPVATSLSGGLDSSSVLCSLARSQQERTVPRQAPEWRRAFIAGFPGTSQDETVYASLAASAAGAQPIIRHFKGGDFRDQAGSYLGHFDEIGNLNGIAPWALYREMRRNGIVISLDGHGGDELLGGYGLHVLIALFKGGGILLEPRRSMDLIHTLHRMYDFDNPEKPRGRAVMAALTLPGVHSILRRIPAVGSGQRRLAEVIKTHSFDPGADSSVIDPVEERAIEELGPLTAALYHSFHRHSLPRILRNFDLYSMAHGVEVRMPLLDWRVVCYGFSVPDTSKVSNGYTKHLLREAMNGVVPEQIRLRRQKLGYNSPVPHWLNDGLEEWVWNEVNHPEFIKTDLWDGRRLQDIVRRKRQTVSPWDPQDARTLMLAITCNWWLTRWLKGNGARLAEM